MTAHDDRLIQRLRERIADRGRASSGGIPPRRAPRPVAAEVLQSVERALGFEFPDLLRAIYLEVGNGGFGPAYGIVGMKEGAKRGGRTLEAVYRDLAGLEKENSAWRWPERLLPLADYGCGMWSCVDCAYQKLPMILWDPNNLASELDGAEARLNWSNAFWDQGRSLRTWLEGWLADEPEPEPNWPSGAWTRRRLRFRLPK